MSSIPLDVTGIDDKIIAVSGDNGVKVINIVTSSVERSINIGRS